MSTPGVLHLLGRGSADLIPCEEIERIQAALAHGYRLQPHPDISKGMRVRLKTGIFADVEGRVTEIRQNCRVVLALSGVDQCFSLETRMEDLEIIGETAQAASPLRLRAS